MNKIILLIIIIISLIILILSIGLIGLITLSFMGGCYPSTYPAQEINHECIQISKENSCVPYLVKNICDKNYVILSEGLLNEQEIILEKDIEVFAIPKINSELITPWTLKIIDKEGEEIIINGKINYKLIENENKRNLVYYSLIIILIISAITFLVSGIKLLKK